MTLGFIPNIFKTIGFIACIIFGGLAFFEFIEVGFSLYLIFYLIVFCIVSTIAIFIPSEINFLRESEFLSSLIIWLGIGLVTIGLIYSVFIFRNSSENKYSVEFYWEEGLSIDFKEDGSYRAINQEMFRAIVNYGSYSEINNKIILHDRLKFGMSFINDTLYITDKGLEFEMETPWRVENGLLTFK